MSPNDLFKIAAYGPDMAEYLELLGYDSPAISSHAMESSSLVEGPDLGALAAEASACTACPLAESRKQVVFGEGNPQAKLMFIGEAPGYNEDQQGRPFVGPAGELLVKMISAMGFAREDVYIANVIKCRPPENRDPTPEEIQACSPFLNKELELVRPEVIVTLGTFASQVVLEKDISISKLRGKQWERKVGDRIVAVFPTFHPAFLLRNADRKKDVWEDLKLVMSYLGRQS